MAKKIVVDDASFSRNTISGAGKGEVSGPFAPDMKGGAILSSSRFNKGRGEGLEDELQGENTGDVAENDQSASDSFSADSDQPILLAQADAPGAAEISPGITANQGAGVFSSPTMNWWVGGIGLAVAGTGVGLALSSNGGGGGGGGGTPNVAPVITSGATGSVAENVATSTVIYDTAATDADAGNTITYRLKAATGDVALLDINATTGEVTLKASADYESKASYSFTVIASDGTNSSEQAVTVNVTDLNDNTPVITSGATGSVAENAAISTVIYDAAATDADVGSTITYSLKAAIGDVALLDINATTGEVTLKASADYESKTGYSFTVIASDGSNSSEQAVVVSVDNMNDAPIFTSSVTGSVAENAAISTVIYDAAATDADAGNTIAYSLKAATGDVALLDINATTGEVTLKTSADYESKTSYSFTVIASDGSNSSEQAVTVNVTDLNDNTPVFTSGATGSVAENAAISTVIYDAAATDADAGNTVTYSLKAATGDVALLDINATTGEVTLNASADYETKASYSFTVIASDGSNSSEKAVTVSVNDVNEAPVITNNGGGATANVSVAEGIATVTTVTATEVDAGDTKTYSIASGVDASLFDINPTTGELTFRTAPNFEAPADGNTDNVYDVQVKVTDNGTLFDLQDITITVTDVFPEPPIFSSGATGSVNENVPVSTMVYDANTDSEGSGVVYSLIGSDSGLFSIDPSTGEVGINSSVDYESKSTYNFTVVATNAGAIAEQPVIVTVTNVNDAPVITSGAAGSVDENANISTVVYDANATDQDTADTITYTLGGVDAAAFDINSSSGAVTLKAPADFETKASYSIDVIATDNGTGTLADTQAVTISISNVNETPVITSNGGDATASVNAAENQTAVTTVNATDVDAGDTQAYTISGGADQLLFDVDSNGVLTFKVAPDYENPTDSGVDNVYEVQVTVADSGGLTDVQDITVTVTDNYENVVVESGGAFIDQNGNGVKDTDDTIAADFTPLTGNVDLANNPIIIHYNNIPDLPLNLIGFGSDDLIEIDVVAFAANGYEGVDLLNIPAVTTLDEFVGTGSYSRNGLLVNHTKSAISVGSIGSSVEQFGLFHMPSSRPGMTISLHLSWENWGNTNHAALQLGNWTATSGSPSFMALASFADLNIPGVYPLQKMVDFVYPYTHVVVEKSGPYIDANANGVLDAGETTAAVFTAGGNADLEVNAVLVHFNDVPDSPIDLTGFTVDDKIEIDMVAFNANWMQNSPVNAITNLSNSVLSALTLSLGQGHYNTIFFQSKPSAQQTHLGALAFWGIERNYLAYWDNSSNPLLDVHNILPGIGTTNGTIVSNATAALSALNQGEGYGILIDFLWPPTVNVVVDDANGQVATFIDTNGNGMRDGGENTLALFGPDQGQADVDTFNNNDTSGTIYDSQVVNLATERVNIHYNDLPTSDWMPNLSGFDGYDRITIDADAMRRGVDMPLNSQTSFSVSTTVDNAGLLGWYITNPVGSPFLFSSVYLDGGNNLIFGHSTANKFTATGPSEGIIASNAAALAGNFQQQVVFVMDYNAPI